MTRTFIAGSLIVFSAFAAFGQEFDVASVKPDKSGDGHSDNSISSDQDAVKLTFRNVSLLNCIQRAYEVKDYQISGPDWLKSEKYDIIATVPDKIPNDQLWPMLQKLLANRFQLKLHRETKVLPIYEMVVARSGLKIKEVEPGEHSGTWQSARELTAKSEPLPHFADVLSRLVDRPVVDKTGVSGVFDFALEYSRDDGRPVHRPDDNSIDVPPSIFTALQEKLGLKLEPKKGPVEILVIDAAEKVPTEN
jgi:uncharacterized protein (TIGR03435 family)